MKSSFCIDLQRFMLIPTKFPLSLQYCKEILNYAFSVNLYLTEIYAQKKDAYQLCILLFEPLVGFEPTTPRLQITCSGQLS